MGYETSPGMQVYSFHTSLIIIRVTTKIMFLDVCKPHARVLCTEASIEHITDLT